MRKTDLNRFDAGGKHSENKNGGIPLGQGVNGLMNTVEEGETSSGDFVFSDTIKLTKDVINQFNLPKSLEGRTVASATKFIDNKFKDRNDKISLSTKTKMLDGIAAAQETIKSKQQNLADAFAANSTEVPDMMDGQIPEGFEEFAPQQNQMFLGGDTNLPQTGGLLPQPNIGNVGNILGSVSQGAGLLNQAQGNTSTNAFNASLSGAASGAATGSILGPVGAGIGGIVGLGAGLIGSFGAKKRQREENRKNHIIEGSMYQNDFALGGPLDKRQFGNQTNPILNVQNTLGVKADGIWGPKSKDALKTWQSSNKLTPDGIYGPKTFEAMGLTPGGRQYVKSVLEDNPNANDYNMSTPTAPIPTLTTPQSTFNSDNTPPKANFKPVVDWLGNNYGNILRYAPVVGNALQLSKLKRPGYENLNKLDNRFVPDYVDEKSVQNIVGNEFDNVSNALVGASNGSQGALRSNLLGASLNRTKAMSDAYLNASAQNRAQNLQGQQFNAGIDQTNLNQSNLELDINDRNKAAYDTNKSRLESALYEDIGNIGKEEVYKKMAKEMFSYTFDGKYYTGPDGIKKTPAEVKLEVDSNRTNQTKLGGLLTKYKK